MEEEIIITGRRPRDNYQFDWFWRDWLDTGFGYYYIMFSHSVGAAYVMIDQVAIEPENNYTIPATSKMPKIELRDLTKAQFEAFMRAYDNIAKDPELAAQFQQLATNGVTLTLTVAAELPVGASPDARATITFMPVAGDLQGNNQSVMPNTEVEIVIKASRIRNDMTWEDTFEGILAHEFTHLKRDSNGRFLSDPATYDHDDGTYDKLFGAISLSSYSNSLDVVSSIDEYGYLRFTGTDGNNHIRMLGTDAFSAYTGGGNDMVIGQTGIDIVYVTGGGKKAIVEPGAGHDMIALFTIDSLSKVVLTYIGPDLYITSSDSSFAPADDPNAVVVIGQASDFSQDPYVRLNAVEIIMTADGNSMGLYGFWSGESSAQADQTFAFSPDRERSADMDRMSIFTADSPIADASLGHAFYSGDSSPVAIYEFMIHMALLHAPRDSVWPG